MDNKSFYTTMLILIAMLVGAYCYGRQGLPPQSKTPLYHVGQVVSYNSSAVIIHQVRQGTGGWEYEVSPNPVPGEITPHWATWVPESQLRPIH